MDSIKIEAFKNLPPKDEFEIGTRLSKSYLNDGKTYVANFELFENGWRLLNTEETDFSMVFSITNPIPIQSKLNHYSWKYWIRIPIVIIILDLVFRFIK